MIDFLHKSFNKNYQCALYNKDLCQEVSHVLLSIAHIPSPKTRKYFNDKTFLDIFYKLVNVYKY